MVRSLRLGGLLVVGEGCVCAAVDALCVVLIHVVHTAWFKGRGGRGESVFAKMD